MTDNTHSQINSTSWKGLNDRVLNWIEPRNLWNSLALILGRFSSSGLGFLTWLIIARLYPTTEVGIASGVIAAMMLCVQLALLGLNSGFVALYPRYRQEPSTLLNTTVNLVSLAALLAALLFLLLSSMMFQELSIVSRSLTYIFLFLGMAVFSTVNTFLDHVSIAVRRSDQVLVRNICFGVVMIVLVALSPSLTGSPTSGAIVFAWMLAGLCACTVGSIQIHRSVPEYHYRLELRPDIGRDLVRVSLKNYFLTLTERAPNWILPILVTELLSPTDNAHWYMLWMMAWVVYIIPISVGQNLFADVSHQPGSYRQTLRHSMRTSLFLGTVGAAGAIVLAKFFLSLLGTSYALAGTLPLRILVLGVYPVIFIQAYYGICRGKHMLTEAIWTGIAAGCAGVLLAALAGLRIGLVGMALAWLVTQSLVGAWALIRLKMLSRQEDG